MLVIDLPHEWEQEEKEDIKAVEEYEEKIKTGEKLIYYTQKEINETNK